MASHGVTMNGRISTELKPRPGRSIGEELASRLALLDGKDRFALLLWRLAAGVPFDQFDLVTGPTEYIQCAGGVSGRFTCEVCHVAFDGTPQHEIIGRAVGIGHPLLPATVRWSDTEATVQENEVLSLDEVSKLFQSYLACSGVPPGYQTRVVVP